MHREKAGFSLTDVPDIAQRIEAFCERAEEKVPVLKTLWTGWDRNLNDVLEKTSQEAPRSRVAVIGSKKKVVHRGERRSGESLRFTPAATEVINLILSDVGRPVGHIASNLVGYDDIGLAARVNPSLSTISQDIPGGGKALVEKLMRLISGHRVQDAIAPARLVVRASSQRNSP